MTDKKLREQMRGLSKQKADRQELISGLLGINIDGAPAVEVSNRDGYVWVRLRGNMSELIQAYNGSVSPIFDLPVLVTRSGNRYVVYGRDLEKYGDWGDSSYLPRHGGQHSFAPELGLGGDVTWIYSRQFVPLSSVPSGSFGAGSVIVNSYVYRNPSDGTWKFLGDIGSPDALPLKPTGTSARMVLLCVDTDDNTSLFLTGTTFFSSMLTGVSSIAPYIPAMYDNHLLPISAIRLVSGTNVIGWDNIYDMRQFSVSTPPPFAGGVMIQDEGVNVGTGTILNFAGGNVTASVAGDTVTVYITGSTVAVQDEGVAKGNVSTFNFVGNNVDASVAGSVARIFITGSTTTNIQDEGVPKGTALTFNFVGDNVDASVSGTVVRVFVTGSSGGGVSTGAIQSYGNTQWLRLDTTNDPIHGNLSLTGTFSIDGFLSVDGNTAGAGIYSEGQVTTAMLGSRAVNSPHVIYQEAGNVSVFAGVLNIGRYAPSDSNAPLYSAPVIDAYSYEESGTTTEGLIKYDLNGTVRTDINPSKTGTGTAVFFDTEAVIAHHGKLLLLSNAGTEKFWVNGSGTAFSNNSPLIKEAPVDGSTYGRKNAGWELVSGSAGTVFSGVDQIGVYVQDEGVPLGTGTTLNFVGGGIDVSLSGTVARIFVTGSSTQVGIPHSVGLVGFNNTGTPNTQYDFSADAIVLYRSSDMNTIAKVNTGAITNNVSTAGPAANGRDQAGAFSASSWIHFYFIWNGTTLATLSSATAPPTGPTLPATYTHWCYLGAVRFNGSSQLLTSRIEGNTLYYPDVMSGTTRVLSGGTATTSTSVSMASFVPPNALSVLLAYQITFSHTTPGTLAQFIIEWKQNLFYAVLSVVCQVTSLDQWAAAFCEVPNLSQTIYYWWTIATGGRAGYIDIGGYRMPNGG